MDVRLLIDAIVRQTTVLIAQLATTAGVRAPLAHVANQIFLDLVAELESQGVGRKVIADMFGLALRSYQQKVQRLSESATFRGVTLWEAVLQFIRDKEVVHRADILTRFQHDNDASVRGILNDLVESGLIYRTGRGDRTVYRITPDEDVNRASANDPDTSTANLVWLTVYRSSPITRAALTELLPMEDRRLDTALATLEAEGRIRATDDDPSAWSSDHCFIPIGDAAGWEAALFDHYQAVVTAVCTKLRNGTTRALPSDRLGGSTFSYDVWPGHPHEDEVYALLSQTRTHAAEVWDRVRAHNAQHGKPPEGSTRATFYCGQTLKTDAPEIDE